MLALHLWAYPRPGLGVIASAARPRGRSFFVRAAACVRNARPPFRLTGANDTEVLNKRPVLRVVGAAC